MNEKKNPEGDYVWDIFENAWVPRDYWQYVEQARQVRFSCSQDSKEWRERDLKEEDTEGETDTLFSSEE